MLIATLVPLSARAAQSESGGGTLSGFFAAHGFAGANNHVGGAFGMAYERYGRPEFIFAPSG
ncbi:MAG: hypothetical protein DMF47_07430 [Verrucomicrobia bacterium]|nr:MAG: hypothetical protein DMF47_07430 [Verrucomicrobiota bacterium]PYL84205.1 MAG: hypothetical protein DMF17_11650 [Verrucomicrobiota bacterium]